MKKKAGRPPFSLKTGENITFSSVLNREYIKLALPLVLQSILVSLVNATDSLMLGRLSQSALSAITLACQLTQIFQFYISALCIGCTALQAQYFGSRDLVSVRRVTAISVQFSLGGGLLFFFLSFVTPDTVMRLFTNDPELIDMSVSYLRYASFSYLFLGISQMYLNAMKNIGQARISAAFGSVAVVLNILLNYLLIFGSIGFPALGVRGAAIATTTARGVELLLTLLFVAISPSMKDHSFRDLFGVYRGLTRKFIRYSVPSVIQCCSWMIATALTVAVLGHMGSDIVAASSVALILYNICSGLSNGLASAAGVKLGQLLGRGEVTKARRTGDMLLLNSLIAGILLCILLVLAGPLTFPFFNTLSDPAMEYLKIMAIIVGVKCIGKAVNITLSQGIFISGGDIMYLLKLDVINMWLVILPLSVLSAFVFHLPPIVVYLVINLDEFTKIYHMVTRYRTYIWAKNLTAKDWAQPGKYDRQIRRQIIEEMPLGVMVISNAGRVVLVNDACARLLDMTRETIESSNYKTLFLTEDSGNEMLSDLFIDAMNDKTSPKEADLYYPDEATGRKLHIRASYMEDEDCRIGLCVMLSPADN